jgi:hypothetical protein
MAVLGVGADHAGMKAFVRQADVHPGRALVTPIDALADDVERAERELDDARRRQTTRTAELWGAYKTEYERYLDYSRSAEGADQ